MGCRADGCESILAKCVCSVQDTDLPNSHCGQVLHSECTFMRETCAQKKQRRVLLFPHRSGARYGANNWNRVFECDVRYGDRWSRAQAGNKS